MPSSRPSWLPIRACESSKVGFFIYLLFFFRERENKEKKKTKTKKTKKNKKTGSFVLALNQSYLDDERSRSVVLSPGDEVAVIPPISGG